MPSFALKRTPAATRRFALRRGPRAQRNRGHWFEPVRLRRVAVSRAHGASLRVELSPPEQPKVGPVAPVSELLPPRLASSASDRLSPRLRRRPSHPRLPAPTRR